MDSNLQRPVKIYYCKCGHSVEKAGNPDTVDAKEYNEAAKWGRKVETVTIEDFRKLPFMDCGCFKD